MVVRQYSLFHSQFCCYYEFVVSSVILCSFKYIYCFHLYKFAMYFDHIQSPSLFLTSLGSMFPFQLPVCFFFLNNPLYVISASHTCMSMGPSTRPRSTFQGIVLIKKMISSLASSTVASQSAWRLMPCLPHTVLIFCRSCAGNHSFRKFMNVIVLSSPKDTTLPQSSTTCNFYSLSSLLLLRPLSLQRRVVTQMSQLLIITLKT